MNYLVIRIEDNVVVGSSLSEEEAKRILFFYDCEENPHQVSVNGETHFDRFLN